MTMHYAPPGAQARASALLRTVPLSLWPQAVRDRRSRLAAGLRRLEDLREELVAKLDQLTADPDLEPSLGAPEHLVHLNGLRGKQAAEFFIWCKGATDDREGDGDRGDGGRDADLEPSLGAPDWTTKGGGRDQTRWALGEPHDLELANEDGEHSMGWTEHGSLTGRLDLGCDDKEPSLASLGHRDQRTWGDHHDRKTWAGFVSDGEEQCEDEGIDTDREPDIEERATGAAFELNQLTGAAAAYWAVPRLSG